MFQILSVLVSPPFCFFCSVLASLSSSELNAWAPVSLIPPLSHSTLLFPWVGLLFTLIVPVQFMDLCGFSRLYTNIWRFVSTDKRENVVFVCLCLDSFSQYNIFLFHPFIWKVHYFIFLYSYLVFHSICIIFHYRLICWMWKLVVANEIFNYS